MSLRIAMVAAVVGYIAGAIPFAAIVVRLFGRGRRLQESQLRVPGSSDSLQTNAVSATAVRLQLGARYGCLTSILDMAKAAAVTLAFRLAYPDHLYYLIASGFAVVGHVWPVFYRFRGGRGQSPAIGGLFVVDWPTPLIVYPAAQILGLLTQSRAYVGRFSPMLLAAVWLFFRFRRGAFVAYAIGIMVIRLIAMRQEIQQFAKLQKSGQVRTLREEAMLLGFGATFAKLAAFLRRLRSR